MAQFNPLFLDTGSIEVIPNNRNSVVDYIHFPTTGSNSIIYTTLLPDPFLVASQSTAISNAVNTTSSSLYRYNIPNRVEDYFYSTNAIIGVSTTVTTTGARIGLQLSQNNNTAFNIKSPSSLTAFTFACVGTEDSTIFVLPAGHAAINTIYPTHVRGLTSNILTSPTSNISNTFLLQPETNNSVTAATGSVFYNQFAGFYYTGADYNFVNSSSFTNGIVYSIAVQPDEKIVAVGSFTNYSGSSQNYIVRLNKNGTLDTSFNVGTSTDVEIETVAIQNDSKILIGGDFISYSGSSVNGIARLNTDGTLDTSFNIGTGFNNSGGGKRVYKILIQNDGKILVGGSFTTYSGSAQNRITRLNADGTRDTSFNVGSGFSGGAFWTAVRAMDLQSDSKILAVGQFTSYAGTSQNNITRLNTDGTRDTSFNIGLGLTGSNTVVRSVLCLNNGNILTGGEFQGYSGSSRIGIASINPNGTLDTNFNIGNGFRIPASALTTGPYALYQDSQDIIWAGGPFTQYSSSTQNGITRLNLDGTINNPDYLGSGISAPLISFPSVYTIAAQPDGGVLLGGPFTSYKGISEGAGRFLRLTGPFESLSPLYLLSGSLKAISGSDTVTSTFLPATSSLWISQSLTTNVSNTSNTVYATVFDTAGLVTGQRYLANLYIAARTAATTTGFRMRVQNGTEYRGSIWIPTSATAVAIQNSANGTNITNAIPTAAPAGTFLAYAEYTFVKGATNPQVQILSEINGSSVTAGTGSVIFYRPITH